MKIKSFRYGIHPEERKDISKSMAIEALAPGSLLKVPLNQHIGRPAKAVVAPGDAVKEGQLIAEADGFVSANIHSPVSGTVIKRETLRNYLGTKTECIFIENDFKYVKDYLPPAEKERSALIKRAREAGIVGMGGAGFPLDVKLSPKGEIRTLLINGSECEPYITADYRLMAERAEKIVRGVEYLKIAAGAENAVIGVEANKADAYAELMKYVSGDITVEMLKTKYPQGGEKQLIYALTKKKVPAGKLPADIGYLVSNVATAYAMAEAVEEGKPLIERIVTVSGLAVKKPANYSVRIGTSFRELKEASEAEDDFVKAIAGGPMMGVALHSVDFPVTKTSGALLLLTEEEIRSIEPTPCLNCGRCANVCPMSLLPMKTDALILADKIDECRAYHPELCIECGCCAYVCPAKRPLVQSQRIAKKLIRERGK